MADANSAYTLADAAAAEMSGRIQSDDDRAAAGARRDHRSRRHCRRSLQTPICLDECIRSAHQAEQAIRMKACGIINIKLGRVGGFREAKRVHDVAQQHGIPVWCGGMLESGIGRAHNIALSTLPNFILPGDVSASKRYWTRDIISPGGGSVGARNDHGAHRPGIRLRDRSRFPEERHGARGNDRLKAGPAPADRAVKAALRRAFVRDDRVHDRFLGAELRHRKNCAARDSGTGSARVADRLATHSPDSDLPVGCARATTDRFSLGRCAAGSRSWRCAGSRSISFSSSRD